MSDGGLARLESPGLSGRVELEITLLEIFYCKEKQEVVGHMVRSSLTRTDLSVFKG